MNAKMRKNQRVVILGGSFAGAYCAQKLEALFGRSGIECVLIDRNNYFIFYPLLVEAGTGSVQPRHAVIGLRSFLKRTQFRKGEVTAIDPAANIVEYVPAGHREAQRLDYDHLVFALGSVTKLPPVPGLHDYGFEIKTIADAVSLRDRAIELLEHAENSDAGGRGSLLHFVVVGANFTGVEVAGEFDAFLRGAASTYPGGLRKFCRVTLIERSDRILSSLDRPLSEYAADYLRRRGIEMRFGRTVKRISAEGVLLDNDEFLPAATVVWCAGIAPSPLLEQTPFPRDRLGYLLCDPDLRVHGFTNVWGVGDCAVNPDPAGAGYPATAQHAIREGVEAAKNIVRTMRGEAAVPCVIKNKGSLAALGCRTGVARVFGLKFSGGAAWFLWRTVYLLKMPGWGRKIRLAMDWTADLLFGQEYVQLGVLRISRSNTKVLRLQRTASNAPEDRVANA